jgi:hypothetical protein
LNWLVQLVLMYIGQRAKLRVVREVKRHGVLAYLKVVQGSRRALLGVLLALFVFQLMMTALVGTLVCGVLILDLDFQLKMQILFGGFAALFLIPAITLVVVFSERFWFKASGAERLMREVRRPHDRDRDRSAA